ncbi:cation diffusion facilitator family transporter [Halomonas halocynthiae]|uniref:cation diffusion facilitator family transporter n=1 Tax=Halomonas halocynthiae TaxID=176290 RepID=UPI000403E41F|nr:cation diffusion facilitator family transporter [Halomonas halocynthiae]
MGTQTTAQQRLQNTRKAHRATLLGAGIDLVIGIAKLITGSLVGSAALIADAIHSFSDLVTDIFVLAATHYGRQEPDNDHPYGHGRIETLATLLLGSMLIFVAGAIAWSSLENLLADQAVNTPGYWAIGLAVIGVLSKEWIFRFTLRVAREVNSSLLEANAWHSRSDALSTVAVLIGLIGAQLGAGWADTVAALIVGLMIGHVGVRLMWESSRELVDTALPPEEQQALLDIASAVPGVHGVHDLRTRNVGSDVLLDLHIVVAPRVTVSEAHGIGNAVCRRLYKTYPKVTDVTFHIDPQDDTGAPDIDVGADLPLRNDVERQLDNVWQTYAIWQQRIDINLHYIDERIDITLFVPESQPPSNLDTMTLTLRNAASELEWMGQLQLWQGTVNDA